MKYSFEKYCKNYQSIENYEKAKKDNFKGWHCHHRLETHTSDGERRLVDISQKELIALGMYYNRPPEELIFLTTREHNAFKKGKKLSDETRRKIGEANKGKQAGEKHPMYGKHHTDETRRKMSKPRSEETRRKMKGNKNALGCKRSEETRNKMREAKKGMRWFNNGEKCVRAKECPEGFTPGRLR